MILQKMQVCDKVMMVEKGSNSGSTDKVRSTRIIAVGCVRGGMNNRGGYVLFDLTSHT